MDWLNLHISIIDSPEATLCDPTRRATWIWLLRFCIGQENGGTISDCRSWGDTTWQQMARVRLREVNADSTLWHWDGDALVVHFYPLEKEAEVQAKRETAKANGRTGGRPRKTNVGYSGKPTLVNSPKAEGNGMERKGMEGEGKGAEAPAPPSPHPLLLSALKAAKAASDPRALDEWFEWLTNDAETQTDEENAEVIRWAAREAKNYNREVRYPRHLKEWAAICATHARDWRRSRGIA